MTAIRMKQNVLGDLGQVWWNEARNEFIKVFETSEESSFGAELLQSGVERATDIGNLQGVWRPWREVEMLAGRAQESFFCCFRARKELPMFEDKKLRRHNYINMKSTWRGARGTDSTGRRGGGVNGRNHFWVLIWSTMKGFCSMPRWKWFFPIFFLLKELSNMEVIIGGVRLRVWRTSASQETQQAYGGKPWVSPPQAPRASDTAVPCPSSFRPAF